MQSQHQSAGLLDQYDPAGWYCEMYGPKESAQLKEIVDRLNCLNTEGLRKRAKAAERELLNLGITFTVYSDSEAIDRILPFDVFPRVITAKDWQIIESGVKQRVAALNLFSRRHLPR